MKKLFILFIFALVSMPAMCQLYHGRTTREVIIYETAGKNSPVIKTLQANAPVFVVSRTPQLDYYNVVEIATDDEGYIHKDFIKVGKRVKESDKGVLKAMEEISTENPELDIINNTDRTLKLKINSETISVPVRDHKMITVSPGTMRYRASVSGSIPITGKEKLKNNHRYTWEFDFFRPYEEEK